MASSLTSSTVSFRDADWGHFDLYACLVEEGLRPYFEGISEGWNPEKVAQGYDPANVTVIVEGGAAVGVLETMRRPFNALHGLYVANLHIAPEYRRRGHANAALDLVERVAALEGRMVFAKVFENNFVSQDLFASRRYLRGERLPDEKTHYWFIAPRK